MDPQPDPSRPGEAVQLVITSAAAFQFPLCWSLSSFHPPLLLSWFLPPQSSGAAVIQDSSRGESSAQGVVCWVGNQSTNGHRSQLRLQRHTQVPVQNSHKWLPPAHPRSLASQCMSGQPIADHNKKSCGCHTHTQAKHNPLCVTECQLVPSNMETKSLHVEHPATIGVTVCLTHPIGTIISAAEQHKQLGALRDT